MENGERAVDVAARCGIGTTTITALLRGVTRKPCGCGRPYDHRGFCAFRRRRKPAIAEALPWFKTTRRGSAGGWSDEAHELLRFEYLRGTPKRAIAQVLTTLLRREITLTAVRGRVCLLGLSRGPDAVLDMSAEDVTRLTDLRKGPKTPLVILVPQLALEIPVQIHATSSEIVATTPLPPSPARRTSAFSMLSSSPVDPFRNVRLQQKIQASRGRL